MKVTVDDLHVLTGSYVLDAISELHDLPLPSASTRIWVARPVPENVACRQIMPVDWAAITGFSVAGDATAWQRAYAVDATAEFEWLGRSRPSPTRAPAAR